MTNFFLAISNNDDLKKDFEIISNSISNSSFPACKQTCFNMRKFNNFSDCMLNCQKSFGKFPNEQEFSIGIDDLEKYGEINKKKNTPLSEILKCAFECLDFRHTHITVDCFFQCLFSEGPSPTATKPTIASASIPTTISTVLPGVSPTANNFAVNKMNKTKIHAEKYRNYDSTTRKTPPSYNFNTVRWDLTPFSALNGKLIERKSNAKNETNKVEKDEKSTTTTTPYINNIITGFTKKTTKKQEATTKKEETVTTKLAVKQTKIDFWP